MVSFRCTSYASIAARSSASRGAAASSVTRAAMSRSCSIADARDGVASNTSITSSRSSASSMSKAYPLLSCHKSCTYLLTCFAPVASLPSIPNRPRRSLSFPVNPSSVATPRFTPSGLSFHTNRCPRAMSASTRARTFGNPSGNNRSISCVKVPAGVSATAGSSAAPNCSSAPASRASSCCMAARRCSTAIALFRSPIPSSDLRSLSMLFALTPRATCRRSTALSCPTAADSSTASMSAGMALKSGCPFFCRGISASAVWFSGIVVVSSPWNPCIFKGEAVTETSAGRCSVCAPP